MANNRGSRTAHDRAKTARLRIAAPRTAGDGSRATKTREDGAQCHCDGNGSALTGDGRTVLPNDAMQLTGASRPRVPVTEFEPLAGACASRTGARS